MKSNINHLAKVSDVSLLKFIGLSIITLGIYDLMWIYAKQKGFKQVMGKEPYNENFSVILAAISGILFIVSIFIEAKGGYRVNDTLDQLANLEILIYSIGYIVWSFRMKAAIEIYVVENFKFKPNINGFLTFIFSVYYIVYIINRLELQYKMHKICIDEKPVEIPNNNVEK